MLSEKSKYSYQAKNTLISTMTDPIGLGLRNKKKSKSPSNKSLSAIVTSEFNYT